MFLKYQMSYYILNKRCYVFDGQVVLKSSVTVQFFEANGVRRF